MRIAIWPILVAALVFALTACNGGQSDAVADSDDREVGVYTVVLDWLIEGAVAVGEEDAADLFVASRAEAPIDVDVQVMLVDSFTEKVPLRFVDGWSEAVLEEEPDRPILDGSMMVGLGAVDPEGDVVEIYADRYFSESRAEAWIVTLELSGESWQISGPPLASDVRPFVEDS